jgi:hypothetical protein
MSNTQHLLANHRYHELVLNADGSGSARVTSTMRAEHWCPEADVDGAGGRFTMFGYYDDRLERSAETGEWLLNEVQLNVTTTEGNPEVMTVAAKLGAERWARGFFIGPMAAELEDGGKAAWNARNTDAGDRIGPRSRI